MNCTIKINMDNVAFEDAGIELARILRQLAENAEDFLDDTSVFSDGITEAIYDINGNRVGSISIFRIMAR